MSIRTKVLVLAAAVTIVGAGVMGVAGYAAAQEPTPAAGQARQAAAQQRRDDFLNRVAGKLNVSLDQLKQAFKGASLDAVDQALADGKINEAQAQKLRDRINSGQTLGINRFLRERRAELRAKVRRGFVESAAGAIGITGDELRTELKSGKSIADVAGERNVSLDSVKAQITADGKAKLDQLVAAGKINQERADRALQRLTDNLDTLLNKKKAG